MKFTNCKSAITYTIFSASYNREFLAYLTRIFVIRNPYFILPLTFVHYVILRLNRLHQIQLRLKAIPDKAFIVLLNEINLSETYVDPYSCALADPKIIGTSLPSWHILCSTASSKKYNILILPFNNINDNELLVAGTMRLNIENTLKIIEDETTAYFTFPAPDISVEIAKEASIALISNSYDCPSDLTDSLLQNYFSVPRYLRPDDLFNIDIEEYAPDYLYTKPNPNCKELFFKVTNVTLAKSDGNKSNGCYIVRGETALTQGSNEHSYLPRKDMCLAPGEFNSKSFEHFLLSNCPPSLEEHFKLLNSCISPFMQKESMVNMRSVFLVKGPPGCGKSKLIQIAAERRGFNLIKVEFSEVQSLTAAQTEAKLRIVLHNAECCVPCILMLNNIQIFGRDAEGQEDERTISSFTTALTNLYKKRLKYPVIVIATADNSDIPAGLQRAFIETIQIGNLDQNRRTCLLEWLLASRGLQYQANLTQVAALCSDFVYADLEALILHAAKIRYKISACNEGPLEMTLMQDDFVRASEHMQAMYSDRIGAPRVPKVYWQDIGGLADLKHEILRRIELPLLNAAAAGLRRSGLLLYGPPGTGKTLLAKAVATECQLHFLSVKGPELLNMYVGQSEKNVRQVFERARAAAPCVIFFDELDSLAPNRGRSGDSGGVMDRVVSQLLAEMDGLESSGSIFIIAATNRPDLIDPALLRPGRFDKLLYVGICTDRNSQLSVLKALTRKFTFHDNGNELEDVVKNLPGNLTGADLYAVCSNAWLLAVRKILMRSCNATEEKNNAAWNEKSIFKNGVIVELEDFVEAARDLVPSVGKDELQRYEKLRQELSAPQIKML